MRTLFVALLACLAGSPQVKQATGTGSIEGHVIDDATRRPLAGARVWLNQTRGGYRSGNVRSDSGGAFRFESLAAGEFDVYATQQGFVEGAVGKRRPLGAHVWVTLNAGESRADLSISMFRAASVSGRIFDERGAPLAGVNVRAWPRNGRPHGYQQSTPTDGSGTYRILDLTPNEYVIAVPAYRQTFRQAAAAPSRCVPLPPGVTASPPPRPVGTLYSEFSSGFPQPKPTESGGTLTYRTTYFPGVTTADAAQAVVVTAGDSLTGFDLHLRPVASTTVKGRLTSAKPLTFGARVLLKVPGSVDADYAAAEITSFADSTGAFTVLEVPAGSYTIEASRYLGEGSCDVAPSIGEDAALTRIPIEVPAAGLEGLVVPLASGPRFSGAVVLKGTSKLPHYVDLILQSIERPFEWPPVRTTVNPLASLTFNVPAFPGSYELQAYDNAIVASWWLESVSIGGRDITGWPLTIDAGDVESLVVTMTDRPTRLSGVVTAFNGRAVEDATVVLFPADATKWSGARIDSLRFQTSRALRGIYDFSNVPAGDYLIATIDESTMDPWPAPSFLRQLSTRASRITIRSGISQTMPLVLR